MQNHRIGKQKNGVMQYGLIYQNQLSPIAQTGPDGSIRSVFLYGERASASSAMLKDGKTYRIITDHLGSVRVVIDTATGEVKQQLSYDVWGNVMEDTNPNFQPFGFAGGLYDPDTGLTRFGARDYDAETGRWTAKDPILFEGGDTNLYGYTFSDPINYIDPNGKSGFGQSQIPFNEINLLNSDPSNRLSLPTTEVFTGDGVNMSVTIPFKSGLSPVVSISVNSTKGLTYLGFGVGAGLRCTITKPLPTITTGDGAHGPVVQINGSFGNGVYGLSGTSAYGVSGSTSSANVGVGNIGQSASVTFGWRN
ncbi:RHS repeat-associated core domain-containing protein [Comamonas odontotermitis]|uniref:RHS repeat-associated core domain-containing protein n=1 Tax=Comamonas odontotermitis TaxID=379895 RepID=UPI001CC7DE8B|nr:RHS repeat-associated core domain-containing protein [Comamonas odontotermitis]UBB17178.1 RHS repeat-associated core domain-containing protein [Comamonas odontotermitis]